MKKLVCAATAMALAATTFAAPKKVALKVWESEGPEKAYITFAARQYKKVDPSVNHLRASWFNRLSRKD
ncbi:MAG: hypothetical protein L6V86_07165 [Treponema sp.]|nr:MAG: hypothetical protein L6V86_07165 [Treponema sp.]